MFADKEHDLSTITSRTLDAAVLTLRMLADSTRLSILMNLRAGELSVGDLSRRLDRPSPAISQHLAKLRLAGLVTTRRDGTTIYYRLPTTHVGQLVADVLAHTQHLEEQR